MSTNVTRAWSVRVFRWFGGPIFRGLFHILARVRIEGVENIPQQGGYLVTPNHVSIFDPPFVLTFWPRQLEIAGTEAVLRRPIQGQLMRLYGAFNVSQGYYNRALLDTMVNGLRSGLSFYIAPEGRRTHTPGMKEGLPGVAYLAAKAGVAVVPVGITGTGNVDETWKRGRRPSLSMLIGCPLTLPPIDLRSPERKRALQENTETIMKAIADLLPSEYRGVYQT
jgi:1-acyl-sn-glycerol-3-phosphate acyltransferase